MELTRWLPIWMMRLVDLAVSIICGAIGVEMDHGLFAVDVLAGLHGVDGGLHVPVVGGADDDGVDVFAGQDLVVVAGGEDVVAPELLAVREAAVVAVGHGDEFDAGDLDGLAGVELAAPAGADEGDLDVVIGRNRLVRLGLQCGQRMKPWPEHGGCRNRACGFQKSSAIQLVHFKPSGFGVFETHITIHAGGGVAERGGRVGGGLNAACGSTQRAYV